MVSVLSVISMIFLTVICVLANDHRVLWTSGMYGYSTSYNFTIHGKDDVDAQPFRLYAPHIAIFGKSLSTAAREVCEQLPINAEDVSDYCLFSISNDLRLQRLLLLESLVSSMFLYQHPDKLKILEQENFGPMRTREHEMLALLQHFDAWDTPQQNGHIDNGNIHSQLQNTNSKTVCIIETEFRLQLLVTFISFQTVGKVVYLIPQKQVNESGSRDFYSSRFWGHINDFKDSEMIKFLLQQMPDKEIVFDSLFLWKLSDAREIWRRYRANCDVIVLPTDYDILHYGPKLTEDLLDIMFEESNSFDSSIMSISMSTVPVVWISDHIHEDVFKRRQRLGQTKTNKKVVTRLEDSLAPFMTRFQWLVQNTFSRSSAFSIIHHGDNEGFRRYFYNQIATSHLHHYLYSSLYIGYYIPPKKKLSHRRYESQQRQHLQKSSDSLGHTAATQHECLSDSISSDTIVPPTETMIFLITYQDRLYSETARGLKQQLQRELNYPHVMIIPVLTFEILDVIHDYIDELSQQQEEAYQSLPTMHLVQIVLTPHFPSPRVVAGQRKSILNAAGNTIVRELMYSYIVVQLEQEWFFRDIVMNFVASVPLLNNALSVWAYSEVQRQAVLRTYANIAATEQKAYADMYHVDKRPRDFPVDYEPAQLLVQNQIKIETIVKVVPIFAPCLPHMPCHGDFQIPMPGINEANTDSVHYKLLFFGHCSAPRFTFLSHLWSLLLPLSLVQFSPPCLPADMLHDVTSRSGLAGTHTASEQKDTTIMSLIGGKREATLLRRNSLVLNIHLQPSSVLEMHRLTYLLSMGKCIISQRGSDLSLSSLSILQGAIYFVDTAEDVVQTLQYLFTPESRLNRDNSTNTQPYKNSSSDKYIQENVMHWLHSAHAKYPRLAQCEAQSLLAYHLMHSMQKTPSRGGGDSADDDVNHNEEDEEEEEEENFYVYGSELLADAMQVIHRRLAK